MEFFPGFPEFKKKYEKGIPQLLWTDFVSDMETPVSAMKKLAHFSPYHLLFESVEGGEKRGRYSIIALSPDAVWKSENGKAFVNYDFEKNPESFVTDKTPVFDSLRKFLGKAKLDIPQELPPMASGIFGYMAYDMVRMMEDIPDKNPDNIGIPDSFYMRPQIVIVFDSVKDVANIIATIHPNKSEAKIAYEKAKKRIGDIINSLKKQVPEDEGYSRDIYTTPASFKSHTDRDEYHEMVNAAKEYIKAGDIFQVVPSRRLSRDFPFSPFAFYRSLRTMNPSPYLFYLNFSEFSLIGSSPEILVRLKEDVVTIRPIAGTRKRGKTEQEDIALEKELLADGKELSEHLMLLDLGRNDVGRVAKPGTVRVTEKMIIERYSHVMHIVSNVEGKIRKDMDAIDALIAGFPAGTVSGAPKIRAMEIIDELESERRSFYGGTVGYFSANGDMDTCIALRTGLIKDGKLYVQAGGGVVADSDPEAEFQETQNKANALIFAAEKAVKFV